MNNNIQLLKCFKSLTVATTALLAFTCAQAASDTNKYTFEYAVKGQPSVSPIQVFDNGINTYFQFQPDRPLPAIFAVTKCGSKVLLNVEQDGAYAVVPGRYSKYSLNIAGKASTVDFVGKYPMPVNENLPMEECDDLPKLTQGSPANRVFGAVKPAYGDDAPQIKRRKIEELSAANTSASRVYQDGAWRVTVQPITPAKSQTQQLPAVANVQPVAINPTAPPTQPAAVGTVLVTNTAPVAPAATTLASSLLASETVLPSVQIPVVETWEIKAGESIKRNLDSWRTRAGWEMVWQYDGDFIAQAGATFTGDFQSAVKSLVFALPENINMKIELATNKLVFVTKGSN